MKLGEVVAHMGTTTSPSFIKVGSKIKKVLLIAYSLLSLFTYLLIFAYLLSETRSFRPLLQRFEKKFKDCFPKEKLINLPKSILFWILYQIKIIII